LFSTEKDLSLYINMYN